MIFEQLSVGTMDNYVYLVGDPKTRDGFVVDPAFDAEKILEAARRLKVNLNRIVLTHDHYDHVNAAMMVKAKTGAKILAHPTCEQRLRGTVTVDGPLNDGDEFTLEGGQKIRVIHTPGHTPGGICLIVDDKWLITGDTLFVGNCGRTDLPGGSPRELFGSLSKLKALPEQLLVMPGHNYGPAPSRVLKDEKRLNPAMAADSFEAFDALP